MAVGRLRGERDRDRLGDEQCHQQHVDRDSGGGGETDEEGGGEDACGHAGDRGDAVGQRGPARAAGVRQVEESRACGAGGRAGGQTLQNPGGCQGARTVRRSQESHGGGLHDQGTRKDGAPSHMVGECSGGEQGQQQRQGVGAEDHRDGEWGQMPLVLVDGVQRRRGTGCGQEGRQYRRVEGEGRRTARPPRGDGPAGAVRGCVGQDAGQGNSFPINAMNLL